MTEVERRAFADRGRFMGDADFYKVPAEQLSSDSYLKERMKSFNDKKASVSKRNTTWHGYRIRE
jgi:gamma-glutamyltranspeptidase/glutathione hydrolase